MYLDTHSEKGMTESICNLLDITEKELRDFLSQATRESQTDYFFDGCRFEKLIDEFVSSHGLLCPIDEVLFFHLGRRLNSASDSYEGKNLLDLLTTDNPFSSFLSKHHLHFYQDDGHIEMEFRGNKQDMSKTYETSVCYLRSRLGYNNGREDFCFNGFALKDILYKNSYARDLSGVPEFVNVLCTYLSNNDIGYDYMNHSKYYCYEYLLPLKDVIFDGFDANETVLQKQSHLLRAIISRINEYQNGNISYNNDNENPILRLSDLSTLDSKYFVKREEITADMLTY